MTEEKSEPPKKEKAPPETKKKIISKHPSEILNVFRRIFSFVSTQERINFARHLSVCIKSGMPLIEALRLISGQTPSKKFRKIIDNIIRDINNGQFFAQSLDQYNYIFGDFFINLIKVGETSGNLSSSLLYLAQELKKQRDINHQVKGAMIYPAVILVATIGITLFLTLFIFPKILPIFTSLKVQLPFTTRFVIQALTFIENYWYWLIIGTIIVSFSLRLALAVRTLHFLFDEFLLHVPFVSGVVINLTMTNFTRSLAVLLKSGMNVIDALNIARGTFHNLFYRREIDHIIDAVKRGESMARHLLSKPKLFPPMLSGMIQIGENTGNLEENLFYLSDYYESEVVETVKNLTTILEPLLLLFMGFLVGFIALSIITPIYKITQGLEVR